MRDRPRSPPIRCDSEIQTKFHHGVISLKMIQIKHGNLGLVKSNIFLQNVKYSIMKSYFVEIKYAILIKIVWQTDSNNGQTTVIF